MNTVLITGANGGVGTALTKTLADDGWRVLAGVRSLEAAASLGGRNVTPIQLDVTDDDSIAAAADRIGRIVGSDGLDALVNNAGIIVQGPLELVPLHALRRQFEVNVIGQIAVTQAFLPLLRRASGTIVNMGAASGRVTIPMLGPISSSKTALASLTDALRMELKHQGVKVTIVEPGAMETEIFSKSAGTTAADGHAGSLETQRLYAGALDAAAGMLVNQRTSPVDGVVGTIVKALGDSSPAARYVVGRDASQLMMLRRVPQGLRDRLLMNAMGLRPEAFRADEPGRGMVPAS
jgi:NAD(P)-dependent dehydrogenase (short-subunit alcohol dehydrogenase family)